MHVSFASPGVPQEAIGNVLVLVFLFTLRGRGVTNQRKVNDVKLVVSFGLMTTIG